MNLPARSAARLVLGPASRLRLRPRRSLLFLLTITIVLPLVVALSVAVVGDLKTLGLCIALAVGLTILARPFYGITAFAAALYIRPEEMIYSLRSLHLLEMLAVTSLLGWIAHLIVHRERPLRTPEITMISCFGLVAILGSMRSGSALDAVDAIAKLVALVILTLNLANTPERYRALKATVIWCSAYLAAFSAFLYFTGGAMDEHGTFRSQATGIFSDPNDLAAALTAGFALCIPETLRGSTGRRATYAALTVLIVFSIFLTGSRGGLLAFITVLAGFGICYTRHKVLAAVAAVTIGLGIVMLASAHMRDFDTQDASANSRFHFWENGIYLATHNPVLGVGYGAFPALNEGYTAHNTFVLCLAELGVFGYFFFIGCLFYCYRNYPGWSAAEGEEEQAANDMRSSRLALTGYLAAAFWISRTYVPVLYLLAALPVAAQLAYAARSDMVKLSPRQTFRDYSSIGGICIGSIIFIFFLAHHFA
ncbi:MAG: O-antigen ligase family protein [Armatimonadetes bacterium]|nr:O-antigen ligase family protein [Armatimonadota bacterium]MDE2207620.1 O-antigen ligase family protein [Armatimonadota bacterium]